MGWFHKKSDGTSSAGSKILSNSTVRTLTYEQPQSTEEPPKSYEPVVVPTSPRSPSNRTQQSSSRALLLGSSDAANQPATTTSIGTPDRANAVIPTSSSQDHQSIKAKPSNVSKQSSQKQSQPSQSQPSQKQLTATKEVEEKSPAIAGKMARKSEDSESHADYSVDKTMSMSFHTNTFTQDGTETENDTQNNHLNSLFNGHLMKWKYEAEEGSIFLRVPSFLGAVAQILVSIAALIFDRPRSTQSHALVMYVCSMLMALQITILESRFLSNNPLSIRSHIRNLMTRNFNILRFVWGRGLLCVFAGSLTVAQSWIPNVIVGCYLCLIGTMSICVGVHASRKFASLRNSIADESYLLLVFANYDRDADGYIDTQEFTLLLMDLGIEFDDRYTLKAFNAMDEDSDRLISFEEFSHWWSNGFIERGRKTQRVNDEDNSYQRMETQV